MTNTWGTRLDLTDEHQAHQVADWFGGEEYFASNYPDLYTLFQNSKNIANADKGGKQGYQNAAYIVDVVYDKKNNCAFAAAHTYLTEKATRLYCVLEIYRNGVCIGKSSDFFHNTDFVKMQCSSAKITEFAESVNYEARLYVTWQPVSKNILCAMTDSQLTEYIQNDGEEYVESMTVTDPAYKKSSSGAIKVALWRSDSSVDYDYPNDPRDKYGNYEMHLKMSGSATLLENHAISDTPNVDAILNQIDNGSIFYLHDVTSDEITISDDRKTITWNLSDNWENFVPESTKEGNRDYSFDMRIDFMCKKCQFRHALIISSEDYPQYEDYHFYKKIPMINVLWGCLAEGTDVTMSDGSNRKIEELNIGDEVIGGDGVAAKIKNIVTGTEDTIYQLVLESGENVLATYEHPFMTSEGMKLVSELTSHTEIKTVSGNFSKAVSCYPITFGKQVYSIELENGDSFIANGIVSGTHSIQGELASRTTEKLQADPAILDEIEQLKHDVADGRIFKGVL